jgi:hypothetical protein
LTGNSSVNSTCFPLPLPLVDAEDLVSVDILRVRRRVTGGEGNFDELEGVEDGLFVPWMAFLLIVWLTMRMEDEYSKRKE